MILSDAGLVINPVTDYGCGAGRPIHQDLRMRVLRTPHNVVPERRPDLVVWKPVKIDVNGRVSPLDGVTDDIIGAFDRAGPRGAAAIGAVVGVLLSGKLVFGALAGGALGYFGGAYLVSFAKKLLAAQQAIAVVAPSKSEMK